VGGIDVGAIHLPSELHPQLLRDGDGTAIDWNLQASLQVGEQLPPLNRDGDGAQALSQYLRRRKVWMALRGEEERLDEQLTTYSFRHRYAKQMHAANMPIANISDARCHTIEVHLKSYARFIPKATADIVGALNVGIRANSGRWRGIAQQASAADAARAVVTAFNL